MRILVTGKAGQVAQALARVHDGARHELVFLGRPEVDLADPASLREPVLRAAPDIIFSVAAHTQVDRCESDEAGAFAINAESPRVLAETAETLGIPIVHLSTDYVFDGEKKAPYIESDIARPVNIYGRSKLAGEQAVAAAATRHAIVRVTWVYSIFGANFVKAMLDLARTQVQISVVDDQIACPTPALDLAAGMFGMAETLIATPNPALYGVFHGAGATPVDRFAFANAALTAAAARGHPMPALKRVKSADFAAAASRPLYSAFDSRKLTAVYGVEIPGWQNRLDGVVAAILDRGF
jgi:dTDP-4-dehydrorhamnose reductase